MAVGAEGRRRPRPAERPHLHAGVVAGLDPHRGSGLADIPQQWSKDEGSGVRQARDSSTRHRRVAVRQPRRAAPLSGNRPPRVCRVAGFRGEPQKPMPPISSPPGAIGAAFSGLSAMTASVVRNSAAIDAAFCSAERVTFAGSMMPAAMRSTYSPVAALRPQPAVERADLLRHDAALEAGVDRDLLERGRRRRRGRCSRRWPRHPRARASRTRPWSPGAGPRHHRRRCPPRRQPWRCARRPRCGACAP